MAEENYPLSFLKSVSGSSSDALLTEEFEKRMGEFSSSFPLLDHAASFFYLFDFVKMRYLYVSESIKSIMGYTAQEWIERGPGWVFTTVYPEDVKRLKDLHAALFRQYYSIPASERKDYKYVWEVRVVRKDGRVIWLMQQGAFIHVDAEGKPMVTFDILSDMTDFKKDNSMTLTMFGKDEGSKHKLYFPISGNQTFTKREIELIKLIADGFRSKDIAERLSISRHTVDTHRRNMLKKCGVNDSFKLIGYARQNGLI
jgi:DNA-binding CsgD family transcriptional regulator